MAPKTIHRFHFASYSSRTRCHLLAICMGIAWPSLLQASTPDFSQLSLTTEQAGAFDSSFTKRMSVFGVDILATSSVPNEKLNHAAIIMAEYLDNDEDGAADDAKVIAKLLASKATLVMFKDEAEKESIGGEPDNFQIQDLQASETHPTGSSLANGFDATLEEILHLISAKGYAAAYPSILGESSGSALCNAMDFARGGQWTQIPATYPSGSWYHYNDGTCDYACMATEYFYWSLTSHLGAQSYRKNDSSLALEWELPTPELFKKGDPTMYAILTNVQNKLPTKLPDGNYTPSSSKTLVESATSLGSKWYSLTWFGDWMETTTQWIYHKELGWLYLSSTNDSSVWLYDSSLEWLWTNKSVYPYIYRVTDEVATTGNWLYFIKGTAPRKFWDFKVNDWINVSK